MSILTLTTDFGLKDGYVGVMKGIIWGISPDLKIVDITHEIPVQNIFQAAITLFRVSPFFPKGTVHVAVVDPGVGTKRRIIAAYIGGQYYVAPDNGLLTYLIQNANEINASVSLVSLDKPAFWLKEPSSVFHGRDIFAPVGANLSTGVGLNKMGTTINDPVLLAIPKTKMYEMKIIGEVISIDNFGNLVTNIIEQDMNLLGSNLEIKINNHLINGLTKILDEKPNGTLISIIGTQSELIIMSINENVQKKINARLGDVVTVSKVVK